MQIRPPGASWNMQVHLLSPNDRVELRRATGELLCRAPCDEDLSVNDADAFVIGGPGVVPSEPFTFRLREQATLRVEPSSLAARSFGKTVLMTGAAIGIASLVASYVYLGYCLHSALHDNDCARTPQQVMFGLGIGSSLLAGVGGLIMVANPPTKFTVVE
ncbi:MAG TPA: hypothetical protein VGH20_06130 [Myxococcales bacterium]